ncbi:hypothetical protein QTH91_15645 [Variovorax dokdonensis]|uniref:Glycosyltransferase RgtA/B/C/D-like domain-containing protein n=1 Tax=Variovorax dokdonensis TaxID=344883 RepID=A0ABT7NDC9_9BURK|nr:hypothetical protein [Variovorax dokdonensis]MDM0045922.1 hypothetical protein [Variovorax dokdonensis]
MLTMRNDAASVGPRLASSLALLALAVIVLVGPRLYFAGLGLPIQVGDALFFIPTALQHLLTGELSNPYMSPIQAGGGPYTWHGWLYPMALSWMGHGSGVHAVRGLLVLDTLLIALASLILAWKVSTVRAPLLLKLATIVCGCGLLVISAGRPEVMAQLLLVLWLAVVRWPMDRHSEIATAVLLALIAVAQPTIALLGGVLFAIHRTWVGTTREAVPAIAWIAASSIALALLLTALIYPWPLADLAHGLVEQARSLSRRDDGDFFMIYVGLASSPIQIVWLVLAVALGAVMYARGPAGRPASWLFYPLVVLGAFLAWRFGMRISYTAYNLWVFFPLVAYAMLVAASTERLKPFHRFFAAALVGMALVLLLAQVRTLITLDRSAQDMASLDQLVQQVEADLKAGRRVAISPNLALARFDWHTRRNVSVMPLNDIQKAGAADVVYLNQASTGKRSAPRYEGWRIDGDHYMDALQLRGIRIANTPLSYAYARYVRSGMPGAAKAPAD